MPRGGERGGGTIVRRVELQSDKAAQELRRRATVASTRYRKEEANRAATEVLELLADHRLLLVSDEMIAALPWLQSAECSDDQAQRGLHQLIAALWAASQPQ